MEAMVNLGYIFENMSPPKLKEAESLYHRAADNGTTKAILRLAEWHQNGIYYEKDLTAAATLYAKANELGNPEAKKKLTSLIYGEYKCDP